VNALIFPQNGAIVAMANPLAGADTQVAAWFHAHLTQTCVTVLRALSEPGSGTWIGIALFFLLLFFLWRRSWPAVVTMIIAVPGGMLLNELVKIAVQRHRPYLEGPFVDWSGYSFASGHTIGATLLYGQLTLFLLPLMKSRHWRSLTMFLAAALVLSVGFSRIALGAHYLSDVLAAMFFGILWLAVCVVAGKPMRRQSQAFLIPSAPVEPAAVPVATD
jgi:membrane-associated phospholipid phosphatase